MIIKIIYLSMATASLSYLITEAEIFSWFRNGLFKDWKWGYKLFSCGYCLGHYWSAGFVLLTKARVTHTYEPMDFIITWLIIAWLAAFQMALLDRLWGE